MAFRRGRRPTNRRGVIAEVGDPDVPLVSMAMAKASSILESRCPAAGERWAAGATETEPASWG